jgi:transposase
MQNVGKRKSRPRHTYTAQFKADIVEQCQRGDRGINQVARDFNLTESAVRKWVKQAEIDAGARDGMTTAEHEEMARLRAENRQLKEDVEILRRATAFFAKETR